MKLENDLIYGKDHTQNIVSIEIEDNVATIYKETPDGIETHKRVNCFWTLYNKDNVDSCGDTLQGEGFYQYFTKSETKRDARALRNKYRRSMFAINNDKESFMCKEGVTYFKGLKISDVSVLSFDIETTGLVHNETSQVLLIANTYRKGTRTLKKLFSVDDYETDKDMIFAWCRWVRKMDPSILLGHNIFGFDLPYLKFCGGSLSLGRNDSNAKFSNYTSQFRKDGSQSYDYNNVLVYGRELVDTFFLSIKYDTGRKYPSYGLKQIIEFEGTEKLDRIKWDFDKNKPGDILKDKRLFQEFKEYCIDDADDSLALFDLMAPSFYYYTRSIPRSFQHIINSATGGQINSFMIRAYIQEARSLPQASEKVPFEGAISFGNPGLYENVNKVDVAGLYPAIILQHEVYNEDKDPNKYFLQMVDYFTSERLNNKSKANSSKDRYYRDLEQSQKIFVNSAYGFLGAPGLLFNSPEDAAFITRKGREILNQGLGWCSARGYPVVNADTDSFSYVKEYKTHTSTFDAEIQSLNKLFDDKIIWENDGQYEKVLIVKAKNYALWDGEKLTIKGSSLKATMKEERLKLFIGAAIETIMQLKHQNLTTVYQMYAKLIGRLEGMEEWSTRKTITKAVLNPERTNEQRVLDAIGDKNVSEGDKIKVFFKTDTELALLENFDGVYSKDRLYEKLFKTVKIFENVLDISQFPNYKLKRNIELRP